MAAVPTATQQVRPSTLSELDPMDQRSGDRFGHDDQTRCDAEVVRVERVGSKVNVAARLFTVLVSGH